MFNRSAQTNNRKQTFLRKASSKARRALAGLTAGVASFPFSPTPVLVYQMGKVGSKSVLASLRRNNIFTLAFHVHCLSDDLSTCCQMHVDRNQPILPYHLDNSLALKKYLLGDNRRRYKIITLVREPIACAISTMFQSPNFQSKSVLDDKKKINPYKLIDYLKNNLHAAGRLDYILSWFDKELKKVFNVDVFSQSFDPRLGFKTYRHGNVEVLLVRTEDLSKVGPGAVTDFLNLKKPISILKKNMGSEKSYSQSYRIVKENLKLKKAACEKIYSSRLPRHFYSKKEISGFIDRWTK